MDATPPINAGISTGSIPFARPNHIAKAYGVRPAPGVPVTQPAPAQVAPTQSTNTAGRIDSVQLGSSTDPRLGRLVAATVPGGVSFEGGVPKPTTSAIPFYRHPADKNAAATSVNMSALNLGRVLDAKG